MTDTVVTAAAPAPLQSAFRKTKWSVIWLLTLTIFSALTVGGLMAPIQEAVKIDLGLSDFQLAMIVGSATAIPAAILSLPIAWLVDHHTRTRLLIILASFWAIGTIGTAFAQDFYGLFAAKLVSGIGAATAFPVLVSILADVCMPERRGRSMLLISIGAWAGVAAAFAIGGTLFGWLEANPTAFIANMPPWREAHLLVGIAAAILVLPLFLIREPARHEVEQANPPLREALKAFWRRRAFLGWLYVGNFAGGFAEGAAALWLGSVLVRQYGQSPGEFGGWVGLVILGSGILGSIIGGFTADISQKLKIRGAILLPALIATALSIPASAYPIMPNVTLFAWVLFALLLGGVIINLVNSAAIAVLLPNEERATSLAALAIIGKIVGGPVTAAVIAGMTMLFKGPMGLGVTLTWLGVVTGFISLAGYWLAMRYAPRPVAATAPETAPAEAV
ncbi:MFS transporter [Brevundimonas lenta]|uniref:Putative MFS family arabinose efflux permease n=1 Tax=Brevundimonas lenta TaxID=424796 RepID=A0A7W6JBG6_9CAUL|nr:MFS transporter [Brevundimonas lenta]MBB4081997.1 putative MFS family arabinose efflux permease [Brevundimonas lenta]